jgi:hypothetical protein
VELERSTRCPAAGGVYGSPLTGVGVSLTGPMSPRRTYVTEELASAAQARAWPNGDRGNFRIVVGEEANSTSRQTITTLLSH